MKLKELAPGYRNSADAVRHRILELEEQPVRTTQEKLERDVRIKALRPIQRELQEVAVECESYYEKKGRSKNSRYRC